MLFCAPHRQTMELRHLSIRSGMTTSELHDEDLKRVTERNIAQDFGVSCVMIFF
jgi:hypothetical protein